MTLFRDLAGPDPWRSDPASAAPAALALARGPVLLTRDPGLIADLHRLAAAAGAALDVISDPSAARACWSTASVVLVGSDVVTELAASEPLRRDGVHVVSRAAPPDRLFRAVLGVGAESVVELPAGETWLVETLTDSVDGASGRARVLGVVGGCGGAGATTFAAALATGAAAVGQPVTLVDADPLGAGIESVVGVAASPGSGWGTLQESAGRLGSRALRSALPHRDGLAVLGWGHGPRVELEGDVVREALSAAQRGSALVVLDLPRCPGPAVRELLLRCDHLVVVLPLRLPAVAAAGRLVASVVPSAPPLRLVTRGRAAALDPRQVAHTLGVPLLAAMADQRRLAESLELGLGPLWNRRGPLAWAVRTTLAVLGPADSTVGGASS